jgi:hypothetical protein
MGGACGIRDRTGEDSVLLWRLEGKRPRGRTRCRWIILKWMFKTLDGKSWNGLICLWIGKSGGSFECSIEPLGFTKCGTSLDYLRIF